MKILVLLLLSFAFIYSAQADDSEVSHNAEFRMRYANNSKKKLTETGEPKTQGYFNHRFKLGLTYRSGERFSAHTSLIHWNLWGEGRTGSPSDFATASGQVMFFANQAYASWMVSDDFMIKAGRMPVEFADGTVFAENDYQNIPQAFDGLNFAYDTEFAHIDFWVLRVEETALNSTSVDDEEDFYLFSFDIKSLPEFLKMANIHIIQHTKEDEALSDASRVESMNFGLTLGGDAGGFDYRLTYASQGGKTGPKATETSTSGTMADVEFGFAMPSVMNSRLAVGYHTHSGDDDTTDTDDKTYQPLFYEKHGNSGLMDVVDWYGNVGPISTNAITDGSKTLDGGLTDISVHYTISPDEGYQAGIHYHMFSLTEKGVLNSGDLGSEVDLEAKKKYDSGLELTLRLGLFMPSGYLKDTLSLDQNHQQVYVQGKWMF